MQETPRQNQSLGENNVIFLFDLALEALLIHQALYQSVHLLPSGSCSWLWTITFLLWEARESWGAPIVRWELFQRCRVVSRFSAQCDFDNNQWACPCLLLFFAWLLIWTRWEENSEEQINKNDGCRRSIKQVGAIQSESSSFVGLLGHPCRDKSNDGE